MILGTPGLLEEARRALPALKGVAFAKAGEEGVKAVIGRRLATFTQPARSEGEWNAWWADYFDVLSDVALASLEAAMRAYVALPDSEFMPKPGRLRELAFTSPCRSLARYHRASRAVQVADNPVIEAPKASPEDAAAIRRMAVDLGDKLSPQKTKPTFRATPVEVDEGGLSAVMREALARRAAA